MWTPQAIVMLILALCVAMIFAGYVYLRVSGSAPGDALIGFWDNILSLLIGGLFGWSGRESTKKRDNDDA